MKRSYQPTVQKEIVKMFVLDVLQHDIEQITSIVNLLNDDSGSIGWRDCWPRDFTKNDVISVIDELIQDGLVDVYDYSDDERCLVPASPVGFIPSDFSGNQERYWYLLTEKGRALLKIWSPPTSKT